MSSAKSVRSDAASLSSSAMCLSSWISPASSLPLFLLDLTFTVCSHFLLSPGLALLWFFFYLFYFFLPPLLRLCWIIPEKEKIRISKTIEFIPCPVLLASLLERVKNWSSQIRSVCEVSITFFLFFTLLILQLSRSIIACVSFTQARSSVLIRLF